MERLSWYILRRLMVLAIGLFVILTAEFCLFRVFPDNTANLALPSRPYSPSAAPVEYTDWLSETVTEFDQPLLLQYFRFIGDMLTGDFGFTHVTQTEISDYIYSAMWKTLILFGAALSLCLVVGALAGRAISRIGSYITKQAMSIATLALFSVPIVAWQFFMLKYLSIEWSLLPLGRSAAFGSSGVEIEYLIMPLASIVLASIGAFILCVRDGQTKAAASLPPKRLNLMDSLFAAMPNMQFMVAAALLFVVSAEWWFDFPGLGWYFREAIWYSEYFRMQASFFLLAMIVFTVNIAMETVVTLMRPERRLDLCLGEDDDRPAAAADTTMQAARSPPLLCLVKGALIRVAKDYLRSTIGVVSLAVFAAIVALAIVGPWLSSEETAPIGTMWPPQLSTDLLLDGATALIAIPISAGLLALLAGMTIGTATAYLRPYADGVVKALMQGLISVPFLAFFILLLWQLRSFGSEYLGAALACSVPLTALATLMSFNGFVSARNRVATASRGCSKCVMLIHAVPSATSSALSGLKYGIPMIVMTVMVCDFWGLSAFDSWGYTFRYATGFGLFGPVEWGYILAPIIGTALLIGSIFLILDTTERVIRTRFSELV